MRRLLILLAAMAVSPLSASDKLPGLEIRVQSANDLTGYFEYVGSFAGQGEQGKQFAELIKAFGGEKGVIEGVNLKKPLGAYAVFSPGMVDSQFVVMLPVADEKAFVNLLKNRLSIEAKDEGDGLYSFTMPKVPTPFFFRLHEGYACVTVLDPKHIEPKSLLAPEAFFKEKEAALLSVVLHLDRVPEEFRKVFLAQMELKINDSKPANKNAGEDFGFWLVTEGGMRAVTSLMNEGRTLTLKLLVAPKTDDVTLAITLTALEGSDLAKSIAALPSKPALAALAANAKNPVVAFAISAAVPASMKKELASKLDDVLDDAAKNAGAQRDVVSRILESFAPTLKSGDYEFGVAITGEAEDGKLRLVAAAKAKDGKEVERLAREYASFVPAEQAKFEFDVAKTASGSLHKLSVYDGDLKRLYGSETVWAGIGDSLYVLGFEPKGDEAKRVASLTPGTSDMLMLRVAATRLEPLIDPSTDPGMIKDVEIEVFGDAVKPGADEAKLTVKGGEQLAITLNLKGKMVEFMTMLDAKKKAK